MAVNRSEALVNAQGLAGRGDLSAAASIYRQIIENDPFDFSTVNALGDLYVKAGRVSDAITELSRIADGYFSRGLDANAAYILKKMLEFDPLNAEVQVKLGEIYERQKMKEKACECYLRAEVAFTRAGKLGAAQGARTRALSLKPPAAMVTAPLESEPPVVVSSQTSRIPTAQAAPQDPNGNAPGQESPPQRQTSSSGDSFVVQLLSRAEMLVGYGDVKRAVSMLQDALSQRPDDISIRVKLKDIYLRSGLMRRAGEECFEIARLFSAQGDAERARDYEVRARRLTQSVELPADQSAQPGAENMVEVTPAKKDDPILKQSTPAAPNRVAPADRKPAPAISKTVLPGTASPKTASPTTLRPPDPAKPPLQIKVADKPQSADLLPAPDAAPANKPQSADLLPAPVTPAPSPVVRPTTPAAARVPFAETLSSARQATRKRPRWIYATAIPIVCVAALSFLVIRAVPVYEARLDKEYEELVRSNPPPAAPSVSEAIPVEEQPQEQMDVTASEGTPSQPADTASSARTQPRSEREVSPVRTAAQPLRVVDRAIEAKRLPPSPPIIQPGSIGQGIPENPTPAGVAGALPGRTTGPSDPPPPPAKAPGSFAKAEPISRVRPDYPSIARSTGQGGSVTVEVTINDRGEVVGARAVSGPQMLRESAAAAARRWKFKPATRDGKPVQGTTNIVFNFKR